ncbi:FAD-binding domain-containing protein [Aureococcus anophagefferens]|nr:FAD-binding domain-containing protein [Aureococcus anophagefferens]
MGFKKGKADRQSCTSVSQPEPLRVVVIGGGPAGLATAIGFGNFGHKATVIEKRASPADIGTVDRDRSYPVDVTARGMAALKALEIDEAELRGRGFLHVFRGHAAMDGATGRIARKMPLPGGRTGLIGTRDDVVLAFEHYLKGRKDCDVTLKHETTVVEFDTDRQTVTCSDGYSIPYDLLVRYKTFNLDVAEKLDVLEEGWLYGVGGPPPDNPVVSRTPLFDADLRKVGRGVGIVPVNDAPSDALSSAFALCKSESDRSLLHSKLPKKLLAASTEAERQSFETRCLSDASGGFVASKLYSGHCAFVGDAAVSPAPAGQGVNHALDAAASLVLCLVTHFDAVHFDVEHGLEHWNDERMPDEEAYAFLSDANKPLWVQTAVDAAALVGAHRDGPYMKQTEERYRDLTTVHVQLGYIAIPRPPPPKHDDDDLADLQGLAG